MQIMVVMETCRCCAIPKFRTAQPGDQGAVAIDREIFQAYLEAQSAMLARTAPLLYTERF